MANGIWVFMMLASLLYGFATGNAQASTDGMLQGAGQAVELVISMAGVYILWLGLMEIASRSGLAKQLARAVSRPLSYIFTGVKRGSDAMSAICMNVAANFLGMGNAATPFGLRAMQELQKHNPHKERASNPMAMLIVLNSSSVQIIPASIIALRAAAGSANPGDITLPVILATTATTVCSVIVCKWMEKRHG